MKKLILIDDKLDDVIDSDDEKNSKSDDEEEEEEDKEEEDENKKDKKKIKKFNPLLARNSISVLPAGMIKQIGLFKKMVNNTRENVALKRMSVGPEILEVAVEPSLENVRGFLGTKFIC